MKGQALFLLCAVALTAAKPRDIKSDAASACAQENSEGELIAHENCNLFYKCNGGQPVALWCPGGLMYNIDAQYCDWSYNVKCGERTIAEQEVNDNESSGNDNDNETGSEPQVNGHADPSEAPGICAAENSDGVLVAHEKCNQFYKCSERRPVALDCPDNLLYNPEAEYCDWPQNVKCGDRLIPEQADVKNSVEDTEELNNSASSCAKEDSEGVLVAHENCNRFYKCNGGKPVALWCPAGLMYNIDAQYCDWSYNVKCGERTIAEQEINDNESSGNDNDNETGSEPQVNGHADPSEAPAICAAENSDGVLVAHEKCDQFYKCSERRPVALDCPDNLLYNPEAEYCDWPQNVKCGDRLISEQADGKNSVEDTEELNNSASSCAKEDSEGVLVAHENCNRFYKCNGGKPVALWCPAGLMYNIDAQYCDWSYNVKCGERTIAEEEVNNNESSGNDNDNETGSEPQVNGHADPSEAPAICAAENSDGVLVAHEKCDMFYKCSERRPVALDCPDNLLYNPEAEYCDWPQNVKCGDRLISEQADGKNSVEDTEELNNSAASCAKEDSEGVLVAHENCNLFYKCNGGKPVALWCPVGLMYNIEAQYCDWSFNVECGERTIAEEEVNNNESSGNDNDNETGSEPQVNGHADPSEAPAICAAEKSEGILVAHENCNQFYKCSEGYAVTLDCPDPLLYNPAAEYCDWSQNVDCGTRNH